MSGVPKLGGVTMSRRRTMLTSAVTEKDDNLIDLNAYSEAANTYVQDIAKNKNPYFGLTRR